MSTKFACTSDLCSYNLGFLENYSFEKINFIASSQSAGKEIVFKNKKFVIKDFDSIENFSIYRTFYFMI